MRIPGLAAAAVLAALASATAPGTAAAQGEAALTAQAAAPVDLVGTWVSVINEDWPWRMRTPPAGDYASVPLNDMGRQIADRWTEAQDGSCLAHGAAALLRMPTRVRIDWADSNTLRLETDNGQQTRLLRFQDPAAGTRRFLQGHSRARWLTTRTVTGSGATGGVLTSEVEAAPWASLEVITTQLQAAWLRPNGVPSSENAVLTEYFDRFADGTDEWFTVTTMVSDPTYLTEPFVISSNFKREPDDAKWNPQACRN